jgi:hypothetical protein
VARQVAPVVPTASAAQSVSVRDAPDRLRVAQEKALAARKIVLAEPTVSVDLAASAPPAPSLKSYLVLIQPPLPLVWLSLRLAGWHPSVSGRLLVKWIFESNFYDA